MPKATGSALVVGGVALLAGLVAGFLSWFDLAGLSFNLLNGYGATFAYASGGTSALMSYSPLGTAVANAAVNHAVAAVAFVLVLFFWPAMLVSGLINEVGKTIGWQPALWGILALIFAYVMLSVYSVGTVGYGAYAVDLLAVILFLVAYLLVRGGKPAKSQSKAAPASAPASTP